MLYKLSHHHSPLVEYSVFAIANGFISIVCEQFTEKVQSLNIRKMSVRQTFCIVGGFINELYQNDSAFAKASRAIKEIDKSIA